MRKQLFSMTSKYGINRGGLKLPSLRVARLIPSWHLLFESVPTRTQDSILGYNLKLHSQEFGTSLRMFHSAH